MNKETNTKRYVSIDIETVLMGYPDQVNPDLVCVAFHNRIPKKSEVYLHSDPELPTVLEEVLTNPQTHIIGANFSFDAWGIIKKFPQLKKLFYKAYEDKRIEDIQIKEKLKQLSTIPQSSLDKGGFYSVSLQNLCLRYLDLDLTGKNEQDAWRFRYAELMDTPIQDWPSEALEYVISDVVYTYEVFSKQTEQLTNRGFGSANNHSIQAFAAFCLWKITIDGIKVCPKKVEDLENDYRLKFDKVVGGLMDAGIIDADGRRSMKKIRALLEDLGCKEKTTTGQVQTSKNTLEKFCFDPTIALLLEYSTLQKGVQTYIPQLKFPRIHPRYNPIVSTMRTSCRASNYYKYLGKPTGKVKVRMTDPFPSMNIQNIPRDPRFREVFIPDDGNVFIDTDFNSLELVCFAQTCLNLFGYSDLSKVLNTGASPHDMTGCVIYNSTYRTDISIDEFKDLIRQQDSNAKESRQIAKIVNLGIPGGQGRKRILTAAKDCGLKGITYADVDRWIDVAKNRYREFRTYFDYIRATQYRTKVVDEEHRAMFGGEVCGVWLAERTYTSAANGFSMQALGALGAKCAITELSKEVETNEESVLYGSKIVAFIHDELILETADKDLEAKAKLMSELMLKGLKRVCPDVLCGCTAEVQDYWAKAPTPGRGGYSYTL